MSVACDVHLEAGAGVRTPGFRPARAGTVEPAGCGRVMGLDAPAGRPRSHRVASFAGCLPAEAGAEGAGRPSVRAAAWRVPEEGHRYPPGPSAWPPEAAREESQPPGRRAWELEVGWAGAVGGGQACSWHWGTGWDALGSGGRAACARSPRWERGRWGRAFGWQSGWEGTPASGVSAPACGPLGRRRVGLLWAPWADLALLLAGPPWLPAGCSSSGMSPRSRVACSRVVGTPWGVSGLGLSSPTPSLMGAVGSDPGSRGTGRVRSGCSGGRRCERPGSGPGSPGCVQVASGGHLQAPPVAGEPSAENHPWASSSAASGVDRTGVPSSRVWK